MCHQWCHSLWIPLTLIAVAVTAYAVIAVTGRTALRRLSTRPYYILPLALVALSLGWLAASIHCPPRLDERARHGKTLTGRVIDLDFTDFSSVLTVELIDSALPPCRVLLTTRGCDYMMNAGDVVQWTGELREVGNLGNPDEMDYASYLLNNDGIRYQQHVDLSRVSIVGQSPTLSTRLAVVRRNLQLMVFNTRLEPSAQHFVVALLSGNSHIIDKSTRQEFSAAGVAHVLALSGLHISIIALMIWWLLFPLDYMGMKKLRLLITLAAVILFAVFTGLSPSVVRATIMTGFVAVSLVFFRRSVSLNALGMAALLILVFRPSALYGVGFQLSFITVAAILLLGRVPDRLASSHKWLNTVMSTVITSLVAMIATVAMTAHYFHTVSLLSVAANLLILPVLPVFMVLAAVLLPVCAAGLHWPLLEGAINGIYRYIHWSVNAVNAMPFSHVSGVQVTTTGVVLYFAVMALAMIWLYSRDTRWLWAAGTALIIALGHSAWTDWHTPHKGLVVFNSFTSTPVLYYDEGKGYVWIPDQEEMDMAELERYYAGFLARHNISELTLVSSDTAMRLEDALFKPPFAHLMGRRVLAVGRGQWKNSVAESRLAVDDIIVTKRFHGTVVKLKELYQFNRLIISGAQQPEAIATLQRECDSLGIAIHPLSQDGAVTIP